MDGNDGSEVQPTLGVEVVGVDGDGPFQATFRVTNGGHDTVSLLTGWLPHVVLRAPEKRLERSLAPGETAKLEFDVTYTPRTDASEPSNPFLILRVDWRGREWRVLAQLSVAGPAGRAPDLSVAAVRVHEVGFSSGLGPSSSQS